MAKVFTSTEYFLIDKTSGRPFRDSRGRTYLLPYRESARRQKRKLEFIYNTPLKIARVKSRYTVDQFVR
jgi:hypothetical protein